MNPTTRIAGDGPADIFGTRLAMAGERFGRLCVGADPHPEILEAWGLQDSPEGLAAFAERFAAAFAGSLAMVKPQVALFERFGSRGIGVLEALVAELRDAGTLVLADCKRGDIGSTMAGYAAAWLDPRSPLACDAMTCSPYLGVGALRPAVEQAAASTNAVFILAATSNSEAVDVQQARVTDSRSVAQHVVAESIRLAEEFPQATVGLVVGATLDRAPNLDGFNGPILMPGVGAQGASVGDALRLAGPAAERAWPTVSRGILTEGPNAAALRAAFDSYLQ